MTGVGLLRENPTASAEEIREGLAGTCAAAPATTTSCAPCKPWSGRMAHTTEMPALVPGDVIPPESLPGGILSSPTGAEIKVPSSKPR